MVNLYVGYGPGFPARELFDDLEYTFSGPPPRDTDRYTSPVTTDTHGVKGEDIFHPSPC